VLSVPQPTPDVARAIGHYRAPSLPAEATAFARRVVTVTAPVGAARARTLCWSASRLAAFGLSVGLPVSDEVLLHPSTVERFVSVGLVGASTSRRLTLRANLRFIACRVVPSLWAAPAVALPRSRAKEPYTQKEIERFLALARAQGTVERRLRLQGLVCLGAGAGLTGADMRHVTGHHVSALGQGLVVRVPGPAARLVPVLPRYAAPLTESASFACSAYITGGVSPSRHNVTNNLVARASGGLDLPRLEIPRLRATWLETCAAGLGLAGFFHAAGFLHSKHLGDVVARLPVPTERQLVALLGGDM
jgi:hypothetical protein